jgi:hypothetical protein
MNEYACKKYGESAAPHPHLVLNLPYYFRTMPVRAGRRAGKK